MTGSFITVLIISIVLSATIYDTLTVNVTNISNMNQSDVTIYIGFVS
jgi:hypothetical protein